MAFTRVIVHAVWGTQNRKPLLASEIRSKVFEHIRTNAESKSIYVHCVNGYEDHVHLLFTLHVDTSLAKTLQLIKGESSFWINKNGLIGDRFEWAEEYYACSVSESDLPSVGDYIYRQEEHHAIQSFEQEYEALVKKVLK
jgi:putative transposase